MMPMSQQGLKASLILVNYASWLHAFAHNEYDNLFLILLDPVLVRSTSILGGPCTPCHPNCHYLHWLLVEPHVVWAESVVDLYHLACRLLLCYPLANNCILRWYLQRIELLIYPRYHSGTPLHSCPDLQLLPMVWSLVRQIFLLLQGLWFQACPTNCGSHYQREPTRLSIRDREPYFQEYAQHKHPLGRSPWLNGGFLRLDIQRRSTSTYLKN